MKRGCLLAIFGALLVGLGLAAGYVLFSERTRPLQPLVSELVEPAGPSPSSAPKSGYFSELAQAPSSAPRENDFIPLERHLDAAPSLYFGVNDVPVSSQVARLFEVSTGDGEVERLQTNLLICRAHSRVDAQWESFGGTVEPALRMKLGSNPEVVQRRDDGFTFSLPGVRLEKGNRVAFTLYDQDPKRLQRMGGVEGKYDGHLPLHLKSKDLEVTCRSANSVEWEQYSRVALDAAQHRIEALAAAFERGVEAFDYPHGLIRHMYRDVAEAASLVGWADPRAQRLLGWWEALDTRWASVGSNLLAERYSAAPERGAWGRAPSGRVEARIVESRCQSKVRRRGRRADFGSGNCIVDVEIRNLDPEPLVVHRFFELGFPEHAVAVHASGTSIPLKRRGFPNDPRLERKRLEQGESVRLTLDSMPVRPPAAWVHADHGDVRLITLGRAPDSSVDLRLR